MASDASPNSASHCPLCGADNRCAMELERATGQPQAPCWCTDESFPPDLLATLPESAQGASCICINCLRAHAQRGTP
ncbi:cysteine-rich CWC family protein [Hydrogenophaga crassostreae]|uniref:cysteine-rich CWC family protein n=1 Tax=Hydrogenophaga crassostreae TaxID=1763535 RepID=UPI0009EEC1F9